MSGAAPSTFKRCSGARNPLGDSHLRPSALSVVGADQPGSSSSSFLAERPQEPVARPTRLPPRTARRWYALDGDPLRSRLLPVNRIKRPVGFSPGGLFTFSILHAMPVLPIPEP